MSSRYLDPILCIAGLLSIVAPASLALAFFWRGFAALALGASMFGLMAASAFLEDVETWEAPTIPARRLAIGTLTISCAATLAVFVIGFIHAASKMPLGIRC